MIRLLCLLVLAVMPNISAAAEYHIVTSKSPAYALSVHIIDEIVDSDSGLIGLVYADQAFAPDCFIGIDLFNRDSVVRHPVPYVVGVVNRTHGDSVIVYFSADVGIRSEDVAAVYKLTLVGDVLVRDSINAPVYNLSNWLTKDGIYQHIRFSRTPDGRADGVIVGHEIGYTDLELSDMSFTSQSFSTTLLFDLDLSASYVPTAFTDLISGQFDAQATPQYIGFRKAYFSKTGFPDSEGSSVSIFRPGTLPVFGGGLPYEDHWFTTADIFPTVPYDEVIYYGNNYGLDGSHLTATDYLACYNFSSGSPQELWYTPITGIEPDLLHEQRLTAWRGDSILLFIDVTTGTVVDSAVFPYALSAKTTFALSGDFPLHAAGRREDSVFVYRFDVPTDVTPDKDKPLPAKYTLNQNYPNPFNATTEIVFSLPRASEMSLKVYNLLGQEVVTLADKRFGAGEHRVTWDGRDHVGRECASGVYLYRLEAGETVQSRKMLLLK